MFGVSCLIKEADEEVGRHVVVSGVKKLAAVSGHSAIPDVYATGPLQSKQRPMERVFFEFWKPRKIALARAREASFKLATPITIEAVAYVTIYFAL